MLDPKNMDRTPPPVPQRTKQARLRGEFNLAFVLEALRKQGLLTPAQVADVIARETSMRAKLIRERGAGVKRQEASPIEVLSSFAFPLPDRPGLQLDEDSICEAVAPAAGVRYRKIDPLKLDAQLVTQTLSRPWATRHGVLPVERSEAGLVFALSNPFDSELIDSLQRLVGGPIEVVLSSPRDVLRSIDQIYGFDRSVAAAAEEHGASSDISNFEQLVRLSSGRELDATDKPVVTAVEYILRYAFDQRASDIHIEAKRNESHVRMRIDGILHTVNKVPRAVHMPIISRIKMLARMDIAEKRRPQDGRIKTDRGGREVELRVSTIPTAFGEKVVMRVFDPDLAVQDLSQTGFQSDELTLFESWIGHPHGLILVTGPTGSGKTTTLYSALKALTGPDVNVTTIEDPIEMVFEAANQIQVQPKIDLDFAAALRHILRQDPDIIMVGEIRDRETAQNAIQAALTGHLVLSTLHTNNASDALTRLVDLGVEPFLVASSLVGVMAQRLVRLVCPNCAQSQQPTTDQLASAGAELSAFGTAPNFRRGKGCPKCRQTGFLGRTGIFEMLDVSEPIRALILKNATAAEIAGLASSKGMRLLRQAGLARVAQGVTTIEEVVRVT